MRTIRVYHAKTLAIGKEITLSKPASQHLSKVLRLRPGATVNLFNGRGEEYLGEVTSLKKDAIRIITKQVITQPSKESNLQLELVQAIPHSGKMDFIIQKAVELGVTHITPLISEHCSIKLSAERWQKKENHWQKIVINACEQSERVILPILNSPCSFTDYFNCCQAELKLLLHPRIKQASNHPMSAQSISLLIGPEGGFSQCEVDFALSQGFKLWQLGPRILRTETAALAAMTLAQANWGDL